MPPPSGVGNYNPERVHFVKYASIAGLRVGS